MRGIKYKKQFLIYLVSFFFCFAILSGFFMAMDLLLEQSMIGDINRKHLSDLALYRGIVINTMDSILEDLQVLETMGSVNTYINSGFNNEEGVISSFLSFGAAKKKYDQIRLLDLEGFERVRINNESGIITSTAPENLQNKKDRYYFKDTLALTKGEVFISRLDLNIENSRIEKPLNPMIRFSKPLYGNRGNLAAVLIVNYSARELLDRISQSQQIREGTSFMLLNKEGYWLLNTEDHNLEWGFMYEDSDRRFGEYFKEEWQQIQKEQQGLIRGEKGLFSFMPISTETYGSELSSQRLMDWTALYHVKPEYLSVQTRGIRNKFLLLYILMALSLAAVFLVLYKRKIHGEVYKNEISDLYDNAPVGYYSLDRNLIITRMNQTALNWLRYSEEDVIHKKSIYDLLADNSLELFRKAQELFQSRGIIKDFSLDFIRKDGTVLPVQISANRIYDETGNVIFGRTVLVDATERKELHNSLIKAKLEAEQSNEAKSRFLANMSHEIRTPLNGIIGLSGIASEKDISDYARETFRKVHNLGVSLLELINDILDLTKIQADKLLIEEREFDLDDFIHSVKERMADTIFGKGLEFMIDYSASLPRILIGDPYRIGQILNNLIGNAVKFTEKGEIHLRIREVERIESDVVLEFTVSDTGIGIREEVLPGLFEEFIQADSSTTRKYSGTGLGLSICRHLTEAMGGTIQASSTWNVGSDFSFRLKLKMGDSEKSLSSSVPEFLKQKRILLVEDNSRVAESIGNLLSSMNFTFDIACSSQDALEAVKKAIPTDPFDILIIDCRMEGIDGIETGTRISRDPDIIRKPAVLFMGAGTDMEELAERAEKTGLLNFTAKPVTASNLLDSILALTLPDFQSQITKWKRGDEGDFLSGKRILLVEDNLINKEIAAEILNTSGADLIYADNGADAVRMVIQERQVPDLILMDIQMPIMNGYEATRRIREYYSPGQIPIIAITAHAFLEEQEKSLQAGMNAHLSKPFLPEDLKKLLKEFLSSEKDSHSGDDRREKWQEKKSSPHEGIDWQRGLAGVNGNARLYSKLLSRFYQEYGSLITAGIEGFREENLMNQLHNLISTSGSLGFSELNDITKRFEGMLKTGRSAQEAQNLLEEMRESLKRAFSRIRERESQEVPDSRMSDPESPENQREVLLAILRQAEARDAGIIRYFDTSFHWDPSVIPESHVRKLEEYILNFEFKNIVNLIGSIKREFV